MNTVESNRSECDIFQMSKDRNQMTKNEDTGEKRSIIEYFNPFTALKIPSAVVLCQPILQTIWILYPERANSFL